MLSSHSPLSMLSATSWAGSLRQSYYILFQAQLSTPHPIKLLYMKNSDLIYRALQQITGIVHVKTGNMLGKCYSRILAGKPCCCNLVHESRDCIRNACLDFTALLKYCFSYKGSASKQLSLHFPPLPAFQAAAAEISIAKPRFKAQLNVCSSRIAFVLMEGIQDKVYPG